MLVAADLRSLFLDQYDVVGSLLLVAVENASG